MGVFVVFHVDLRDYTYRALRVKDRLDLVEAGESRAREGEE